MGFDPTQLSVLAYANGFTHWHYRTADRLDDILARSYFAPAADMVRPGDQVTLNLQSGGRLGLAHLVVTDLADDGPGLALVAASATPDGLRRAA